MILRKPTVGEMVEVLSKFPPHFRLDFSPGEELDVTDVCTVEALEGDTSDGPGTVWIKLEDQQA